LSSGLKRTSKSSRMRNSMPSGNLRVTMTSGFLVFGMALPLGTNDRPTFAGRAADLVLFNRPRRHWAPPVSRACWALNSRLSYQMTMTRKSFAALFRRLGCGLLVAVSAAVSADIGHAAGDMGTGSASGLPVPRYVSLKSDRVNVRSGPNKDQDVRWVYTRVGMPVEITAEFENWRRIRDWEGAEGWVYHSLLSGKRTAVVVPKLNAEL